MFNHRKKNNHLHMNTISSSFAVAYNLITVLTTNNSMLIKSSNHTSLFASPIV